MVLKWVQSWCILVHVIALLVLVLLLVHVVVMSILICGLNPVARWRKMIKTLGSGIRTLVQIHVIRLGLTTIELQVKDHRTCFLIERSIWDSATVGWEKQKSMPSGVNRQEARGACGRCKQELCFAVLRIKAGGPFCIDDVGEAAGLYLPSLTGNLPRDWWIMITFDKLQSIRVYNRVEIKISSLKICIKLCIDYCDCLW